MENPLSCYQDFYFTNDDHLMKLFYKSAKDIGRQNTIPSVLSGAEGRDMKTVVPLKVVIVSLAASRAVHDGFYPVDELFHQ